YSVIVPLPSEVGDVVVVSETCAHANGTAIARAILTSVFFICFSLSIIRRVNTSANELSSVTETRPVVLPALIGRRAWFGCKSARLGTRLITSDCALTSLHFFCFNAHAYSFGFTSRP